MQDSTVEIYVDGIPYISKTVPRNSPYTGMPRDDTWLVRKVCEEIVEEIDWKVYRSLYEEK